MSKTRDKLHQKKLDCHPQSKKTLNVFERVFGYFFSVIADEVHQHTTDRNILILEAVKEQDIHRLSYYQMELRYNHQYGNGLCPISYAAMLGKNCSLKYILNLGADVNTVLNDGSYTTLLFLAV